MALKYYQNIKFPNEGTDEFRETGVRANYIYLQLIPNANSPKAAILRECRFIPKKDLN
jgi:hypothetical protein